MRYVTTWVPNGSKPGPLLFLVYINNLMDNVCSQARLLICDTTEYLIVSVAKENQPDEGLFNAGNKLRV